MYGYRDYGYGFDRAGLALGVFGVLFFISLVASIVLTVFGYLKIARNRGEKLFDFSSKDGFGPFLRFDTFLLERILKIFYMFTALMFAFVNLSSAIAALFVDFGLGVLAFLFTIIWIVFGEVLIRMFFENSMLKVVIARNTKQIKETLGVDPNSNPLNGSPKPSGGIGAHSARQAPVAFGQLPGTVQPQSQPQPQFSAQYKRCPTCGAQLLADAHFCGTCGTRM